MFNYFGLCVFLMNVSSYAWAQVIVLNQSLWICWKQKVPWNSGTGNLNYTEKGKENCWQIGQNNYNKRLFSKSRKKESWWGGVYPKSVKCLQKKALGRRKMGWRQERNAGINGPKLCISWERLKEAAVQLHLLPPSSSLSFLPFLFPIQCLWICLWTEISPVKRNGAMAPIATEFLDSSLPLAWPGGRWVDHDVTLRAQLSAQM